MMVKDETNAAAEPCTDCDNTRIEKQLEAEEAGRAFQRELEKLALEHDRAVSKAEREHQNALLKAEDAAATSLQTARWQAEFDLAKSFHQNIADVAKGSIDRARDSAKFVQTAATAIATIYTGLLALVFSVTDNPLPLRGVYAGVFLGLSIALSTAYLAYLRKAPPPVSYAPGSSLTTLQLARTGFFMRWINATVNNRSWAIRASVISLAVGVMFVPMAFLTSTRPPSIPDAPVAPTIPATIAEPVADEAAALFAAQVEGYSAAVEARSSAIKTASQAATATSDDEADLNWIATVLAVFGLIAVLGGPWAIERYGSSPA
jgi:hypothetical protein